MDEEKRQKIESFVSGLTEAEAREQLKLAYEQMELCNELLHGHKAEPVEMKDNGLSSDLELFYSCKKIRIELNGYTGEKFGEGQNYPVFEVGEEVFYMRDNRIRMSAVKEVDASDIENVMYTLETGEVMAEDDLYDGIDELTESLVFNLYEDLRQEGD
jgi:hypothetical protein